MGAALLMTRPSEYSTWKAEMERVSARYPSGAPWSLNHEPTEKSWKTYAEVFGVGVLFFGGVIGLAGRLAGWW